MDAPRTPIPPFDRGTTELVRVITFVWIAGDSVQPVLLVDRQLLS